MFPFPGNQTNFKNDRKPNSLKKGVVFFRDVNSYSTSRWVDHLQDRSTSVAIKGRILPFSSTSDVTLEVKSNGMRCDH